MSQKLQDGVRIEQFPTLYRIDGLRYDRVSEVLNVIAKPGLDAWKRKVGFEEADRILATSAALGTRVHAMVEAICTGHDPWLEIQGTDLAPYYQPYVEWHEQQIRQVILTERTLWSETHGYAGTFDLLAEMTDGQIAVLDVKTSRWLSWTYRLQTASYMGAALEQNLVPDVDLRGVIWLSSKRPGKPVSFVKYRDHDLEWQRWMAALELYRGSLEWADDWKAA